MVEVLNLIPHCNSKFHVGWLYLRLFSAILHRLMITLPVPERRGTMSTQKGNQKHLTLSDRINIEKGLNNSDSFAAIARLVHKDSTTISKEVRKHSKVKEYKGYANIPVKPTRISIHPA